MRLLVSGDKHLGLISDGMERLEEQARVLRGIVKTLLEEDPDVFVDLGDLFHVPRPSPAVYVLALKYFFEVNYWASRKGRRAFFLAGNHDKPTRGDVHALSPLKEVSELLDWGVSSPVIDLPLMVEGRNLNLIFLPHVTDFEALVNSVGGKNAEEYLEEFAEVSLRDTGVKKILVFSHLEVPGATASVDETVQRDVGLSVPRSLLEAENVLRVYAGHIHRYQELEKVTVVGSSIYVDFGEADDPKGMILSEVRT